MTRTSTHPSFRSRALAGFGALALLASVLVPSAQAPASAASDCELGTRTVDGDTYYTVRNAADLAKVGVGGCGLDGMYLQIADIVLDEPDPGQSNHTPIGTSANPFTGVYDGADRVISGLRIVSGANHVGLFGQTGSAAELRGIRLIDVAIEASGGFSSYVGALVGENEANIFRSSAVGRISGSTDFFAGGLVGMHAEDSIMRTIEESFASVDVTASNSSGVGGLVALNYGTVERSFATGSIVGKFAGGGLVGVHSNSSATSDRGLVKDSYARGDVVGDRSIGGLLGAIDSGMNVENSYSTGAVTRTGGAAPTPGEDREKPGGLIGFEFSPPTGVTVTASFWDATSSGIASESFEGTPKSTADMKLLATFTAANWDISATCERERGDGGSVWGICEDINDGYPFLRIGPIEFTVSPNTDDENGAGGTGSGSSTPVLTGGSTPVVPTGSGVWQLADGSSTPLVVSTPSARQLRYEVDGLQVTLTGGAGTSVANGLVADANGEVVCEVCATLPVGGVIEAWMFSTPRLVAAHLIADLPCQRFSIPVVAPLDGGGPVTAGAHTLQLALPTASGMQAVNVGVTVGGPVPAGVPAGQGPVPMPLALLLAAIVSVAGAVLVGRRALAVG